VTEVLYRGPPVSVSNSASDTTGLMTLGSDGMYHDGTGPLTGNCGCPVLTNPFAGFWNYLFGSYIPPDPLAGTTTGIGDTSDADKRFYDNLKRSTPKKSGLPGAGGPEPDPKTTLQKVLEIIRKVINLGVPD
jgi:hypothetical protein